MLTNFDNSNIDLMSPKRRIIKFTCKWLVYIFCGIFLLMFISNVTVGYVMAKIAVDKTTCQGGAGGSGAGCDGNVEEFNQNSNDFKNNTGVQSSWNFWANNGKVAGYTWDNAGFIFDANGNPNQETINNVNSETVPYFMKHFYVNDLQYGGTSSRISLYVLRAPKISPSVAGIPDYSKDYAFIIHGAASDWTSSFTYSEMLLRLGMNVVIWDNQGTSKNQKDVFGYLGSDGGYTTYGYKEAKDTHAIIDWFEKGVPSNQTNLTKSDLGNLPVYLNSYGAVVPYWTTGQSSARVIGISLGGAAAMNYAGMYQTDYYSDVPKVGGPVGLNVRSVTEDSGYASLEGQFKYIATSEYSLPPFLAFYGFSFWFKSLDGINLYKNRPIDQVAKNQIMPMSFVQTSGDTYVSYTRNFNQLINAYSGPKPGVDWSLTVKGTTHVYTLGYERTLFGDGNWSLTNLGANSFIAFINTYFQNTK